MNKYYFYFTELLFWTIYQHQRKVNILSTKQNTANWSVNVSDNQKFSFIRVNTLSNNLAKRAVHWKQIYEILCTLLWKFEIINKKFRYFFKNLTLYNLNHMLATIQLHSSNTRDTSNKNEIPIFRQKRKKILLH